MSTHKQTANGGYFITDQTWLRIRQVVLDYYGNTCMSCGYEGKTRIHVDHVLPKRLYPELKYDLMNLQVLCAACNMKKMLDDDDFRSPEMVEGFERYLEDYKARIIEEEGLEHFMENHEEYGFPEPPIFKKEKEFMGEMFEYKTKHPFEDLDRIFRTDLQLEGLNRGDKIALLRLLECSSPDNVSRNRFRGYVERDVVIEPKLMKADASNLIALGYVNHYADNGYILNPKYFPVEEKYRKQAHEKWLSSHLAGIRKINSTRFVGSFWLNYYVSNIFTTRRAVVYPVHIFI